MALENSKFTLLTSEEIPAEIYPYGRVWRALFLEIGAMVGMVLLVLIGVQAGFLRDVPSRNWGLLLILVPTGMYLYFSVRGEQKVAMPREGLLTVTLFSALLANGIGIPLIDNVFEPRRWLADAGFFTRVLGYTCTIGVTSEILKYIAIRYTVFPRRIRTRMDGIAYSIAAGVGYAAVLNYQITFEREPDVGANAMRIAINFISQVGFGVIMGYFLAETALKDRQPLFLAMGLMLGAFMNGLYIAFRAIAAGSGLDNVSNFNGFLLVVFFALMVIVTINFLINNADARDAALAGVQRLR